MLGRDAHRVGLMTKQRSGTFSILLARGTIRSGKRPFSLLWTPSRREGEEERQLRAGLSKSSSQVKFQNKTGPTARSQARQWLYHRPAQLETDSWVLPGMPARLKSPPTSQSITTCSSLCLILLLIRQPFATSPGTTPLPGLPRAFAMASSPLCLILCLCPFDPFSLEKSSWFF